MVSRSAKWPTFSESSGSALLAFTQLISLHEKLEMVLTFSVVELKRFLTGFDPWPFDGESRAAALPELGALAERHSWSLIAVVRSTPDFSL
jgi:hypothetical protein